MVATKDSAVRRERAVVTMATAVATSVVTRMEVEVTEVGAKYMVLDTALKKIERDVQGFQPKHVQTQYQ